ncbi:uncharacterized protein LOC144173115 [Haemaphysalis longicornis]
MAHNRQEFALVGYSEHLERRPLKFVDPIPASRICSACGNIPRLTYILMCGHAFCEPCYESCASTSECVCPLDGDVCDRDDVTRKEYKVEQLLGRKVHCWNEVNGCGVVLPASQIAEHVRQDCQHHVTHCPNCSAVVLSHNICAHLKTRCTTCVVHAAAEARQGADNNENSHLAAFEREVHCWNEANGCLVVLPASQIAEHVRQDCQYHVTRCPTCSVAVVARDVCAHLKSRCTALVLDERPEPQQRANVNERTYLELFERKVEQRVRELDAKLAQLSLKSDSVSDKLIEICHNDNHLKEALTEQFGTASIGTLDRLDRNEAEIKALAAQGKTIEQRVG